MIKIKENLNKFLSKFKVRTRLLVFFLLISIIPIMIIGFFSYDSAKNTIQNKISHYTEELLKQSTINLDNNLEKVEKNSTMIISNRNLMKKISKLNYEDNFEKLMDIKDVDNQLNSIVQSSNAIEGIIIYRPESSNFNTYTQDAEEIIGKNFNESELYQSAVKNKGDAIWGNEINQKDNLVFLKSLSSVNNYETIGSLIFVLNNNILTEIYKNINLSDDSILMITNQNDELISISKEEINKSKEKSLLNISKNLDHSNNSYLSQSTDSLVVYDQIANDWKLIAQIPMESLLKEMYKNRNFILIMVLISIIVSVIIALFISKNISGAVSKIAVSLNKVGEGKVNTKVDIVGKDEFAALGRSFNKMTEKITSLIKQNKNTAGSVINNSTKVNNLATNSKENSKLVSESINQIAEGAIQQAEEAQHASDIMKKLSLKIEEMNDFISNMNQLTDNIKATSNDANQTVKELKEKSKNATQISDRVINDIQNLNNKAEKIDNIINLIEDISEQTDLLSLNASIEAARAGDAGRGFAVVAQEIRGLAEKSSESVDIIKNIIKEITKESEKSAAEVERAKKVYIEQHKSVKSTEKAFNNINTKLGQIVTHIKDLDDSIITINKYKKMSSEQIADIAGIAQESSATTEEVNSLSEKQKDSADQLSAVSEQLNEIIKELQKSLDNFSL